MRASLVVESGIATPSVYEWEDNTAVHIGRGRDNTIVLQDRHASRQHARIFFENGSWFVADQDTINGTRVDEFAIHQRTPLRHSHVIGIGGVRLRFSIGSAERGVTAGPAVPADSLASTIFQVDELTALCRFLNDSLHRTVPQHLMELALQAVQRQTSADLVGCLSLDENESEMRVVLPHNAEIPEALCKHLMTQVRQSGRTFWLGASHHHTERVGMPKYRDAVCVPLRRGSEPNAKGELSLGALHVYKTTRPFSERQVHFCEALAASLGNALFIARSHRALEADNARLREQAGPSEELVGSSRAMVELRKQIGRLANSPCTVLIFGESGVGKELVALAMHQRSPRHKGPMVPVNCGAIPAGLAESEIFGHVKGGFTGAHRVHLGYFAQAEMGTLFLDELGELPLEMQVKLLRALDNKRYRPVGAETDSQSNARIIAATNRNLGREIGEGRFRDDLYYRFTAHITVPPLRDRLEDVPELVEHFLSRLTREYRSTVQLTDSALDRLKTYHWPGNARQLKHVLEGAVALANDDGVIRAEDLHLPHDPAMPTADKLPSLNLEELEAWAIQRAMERTGNNKARAALLLGMNRDTLIRKIKKLAIERAG